MLRKAIRRYAAVARPKSLPQRQAESRGQQARASARRVLTCIDAILESGMDVRASQRLQFSIWNSWSESIAKKFRQPVLPLLYYSTSGAEHADSYPDTSKQQIGFLDQRFEPSPLDELSKLVLTPDEQTVSDADVVCLGTGQEQRELQVHDQPSDSAIHQFLSGRGRSTMESGLRKSGQYMSWRVRFLRRKAWPVDTPGWVRLRAPGPKAMSWAALQVSGSLFRYRSSIWFAPDGLIDERNSFEQATTASARYLKDLAAHYQAIGNSRWRVQHRRRQCRSGYLEGSSRNSGRLSYIAPETRNYVPTFSRRS